MNEYLTILTSGAVIALFALFAAFFFFAPDSEIHKKSLYQVTALLYFVILVWNILYVVFLPIVPQMAMDWQVILAFNIPVIPFVTFVIKEMLYPDKRVDVKTIVQHTCLPFVLLATYMTAYQLAPVAAEWIFGLLATWGVVYVGIMLPLAIVRIRRYNALVQEIFVDTEGRSLTWLVRLSCILFTFYLLYSFFSLYELNLLTTWVFNIFEFVVYMIWGLQISRMRRSELIRIDQPEPEAEEALQEPQADDTIVATETPESSEKAKFVAELEQWLMTDDRLSSNDLNREMVARAMHTNHITLMRILREQTGMTLAQYVTDLRMREAERLLQTTNMSIEQICYQIGYQTRSTFTRAFRDRNHCTATEWRVKHAK